MTLGRLFVRQLQRELLLQTRQFRLLVNSCLFFLMILFIFPMTLRPEADLMRSVAPGLVWMALLLSSLLSSERLYQQDYEHGVIEQWLISGYSMPVIVSAKVFAHWLFNVMPVIILIPLIGLLFSFSWFESWALVLSLLFGSPAVFFLCALAAAFGIGTSQKGALMGLILIPLTLPILIFGSGMVTIAMQGLPIKGYCALLLAISILSVGFLPFAIAGVIRIGFADN